MATSPLHEQVDITGAVLAQRVQAQKWYQEKANTVTSGVGFLVTVAAWAATQPFAAEPWVQVGILIVGFLATVFGVSQTKNGLSGSLIQKLDDDRAEVIGSTPLVVDGATDGEHSIPRE